MTRACANCIQLETDETSLIECTHCNSFVCWVCLRMKHAVQIVITGQGGLGKRKPMCQVRS